MTPFDGFTTDVSITASNGSVSLGQGVLVRSKSPEIVIDQQQAIDYFSSSNGIMSAHRSFRLLTEGDVDIDTSAS